MRRISQSLSVTIKSLQYYISGTKDVNLRRTEGGTESLSRPDQIVLQRIMHGTERGDNHVQEDEDEEENSPGTLVDHPQVELLPP